MLPYLEIQDGNCTREANQGSTLLNKVEQVSMRRGFACSIGDAYLCVLCAILYKIEN